MIRVLVVSHSDEVSGAEHSLLNFAPLLAERGIACSLAARPGGQLEKEWRALGLAFHSLELPSRSGIRPSSGIAYNPIREILALLPRSVRAWVRLARVVRDADAQVVHSNSLITHIDCAVVGRLTKTPAIVELHDIVAPGPGRVLLGIAVRLARGSITISTAVRQQLPRWARRGPRMIPQAIDTVKFSPGPKSKTWRTRLSAEPEQPIVAAIGRIDPEKGLHHLIAAVARVRGAGIDVSAAVVGSPSKDDGGYLRRLRDQADETLQGACRFVGAVDDVTAVLRSVDVLVCPSVEEPFGLIILEAQACGIPVVASASGGPLDFVADRQTGILGEPGDERDLAAALSDVLVDRELRNTLVCNALRRARAEFAIDGRADRIVDYYREVLAP